MYFSDNPHITIDDYNNTCNLKWQGFCHPSPYNKCQLCLSIAVASLQSSSIITTLTWLFAPLFSLPEPGPESELSEESRIFNFKIILCAFKKFNVFYGLNHETFAIIISFYCNTTMKHSWCLLSLILQLVYKKNATNWNTLN